MSQSVAPVSGLSGLSGLCLEPGEIVCLRFTPNLDCKFRFAESELVLTDRHLFARRHGGTWTGWIHADIQQLRRDEVGAVGTLTVILHRDSPQEFHYTLRLSKAAAELVDALDTVRGEVGLLGLGAPAGLDSLAPLPMNSARPRRHALLRLLGLARPKLGQVSVGLGLALAATATGLVPPYLTMPLVDQVLLPSQSSAGPAEGRWDLVLLYLAGLAGAAVATALLSWAQGVVLARISELIAADLRNRTYAHLQALSLEYFGGKRTGDLIARISTDTERLCSFLSDTLVDFIADVLMIVGTASVLMVLDPALAAASLLSFPPIAWLIVRIRDRLTTGFLRGGRAWSSMTSILADTIPGIRVVKAFSQERREISRFAQANQRIVDVNNRVNRLWTFFWPAVAFLNQLGLLVVWAVGAWEVMHHQITVGVLTAFVAYIGRFYTRVEAMSRVLTATERAAASAERLFEILDREPSVSEPVNPVPMPRVDGEITFAETSFRYGSRTVLKGLQLTVRPGEMVGIVGPTGSGKSTVANLVCRFYDPTEGAVLLDGVDLRSLSVTEYRKHLGIVLQESFLFFGTLAENIAYGQIDAPRNDILRAARAARAHEFILKLPEGYDSLVGERGQSLSGGERQRVAIARAILVDPRILILDEATSAIDTATEREIQRALDTVARGRTTIAIAHRLSTLRRADRIIVLKKGRIVEEGSHEVLLALNGEYAKLYSSQEQEDAQSKVLPMAAPSTRSPSEWPPSPALSEEAPLAGDGGTPDTEGSAPPSIRPGSFLPTRWVDPLAITFLARDRGGLRVQLPGRAAPSRLVPVRCFPLSAPEQQVALLDEQGHEISCLNDLSEISSEARDLVLGCIREREFIPVIQQVTRVISEAGRSNWSVETDRGPVDFVVDQEDHLRSLPGGRLLVTDDHGGRYLIPNRKALPEASQRCLSKIC